MSDFTLPELEAMVGIELAFAYQKVVQGHWRKINRYADLSPSLREYGEAKGLMRPVEDREHAIRSILEMQVTASYLSRDRLKKLQLENR